MTLTMQFRQNVSLLRLLVDMLFRGGYSNQVAKQKWFGRSSWQRQASARIRCRVTCLRMGDDSYKWNAVNVQASELELSSYRACVAVREMTAADAEVFFLRRRGVTNSSFIFTRKCIVRLQPRCRHVFKGCTWFPLYMFHRKPSSLVVWTRYAILWLASLK